MTGKEDIVHERAEHSARADGAGITVFRGMVVFLPAPLLSLADYEAVGSVESISLDFFSSSPANSERLAGGRGGRQRVPLVAAGGGEIIRTDANSSSASLPAAPLGACRLGVHSTRRAAAVPPSARLRQKTGNPGPRTPAQISQYAAPPIRYGQPAETVACLPG